MAQTTKARRTPLRWREISAHELEVPQKELEIALGYSRGDKARPAVLVVKHPLLSFWRVYEIATYHRTEVHWQAFWQKARQSTFRSREEAVEHATKYAKKNTAHT